MQHCFYKNCHVHQLKVLRNHVKGLVYCKYKHRNHDRIYSFLESIVQGRKTKLFKYDLRLNDMRSFSCFQRSAKSLKEKEIPEQSRKQIVALEEVTEHSLLS